MKAMLIGSVLMMMCILGVQGQDEASEQELLALYNGWIENLYEFGVRMEGDTFIVTEEAKLAAMDSASRYLLYPDAYTWQRVSLLIEGRDLKRAIWYLINLWYDNENRELAANLLNSLRENIDLPRALAASYYTFIFFDPEVGHFANNKPVIDHPDVMEGKLNSIREMISGQGM